MGCAAPPHRAVLRQAAGSHPPTVAVAFPHRRHRHRRPARPHDGRGSALPPQLRGRSRGTRPGVANLRPRGRSPTCSPTTARWSTTAEFVRAVGRLPRQWRAFRRGLTESGEGARRVAEQIRSGAIAPAPPRRPATRFNTAITSDLTFDVVSFSPSDIRTVRSAVEGATFNDVLLATISGALAGYLAEKDETPPSSLAALVPMSLRGTRPGWRTIRTGTARTTWR